MSMKNLLGAVVLVALVILGYFLLSRYLVTKLDGSGAAAPAEAGSVEMLFVGDIMLDRTVRSTIEREGFDYIFEGVRSIFENLDLAIGNLEGAVTENPSISQRDHSVLRFTFATTTAFGLRDLGFTHMSLANNHALDFGEFGLDDTEHYLTSAELSFFGSPHNDRNLMSVTTAGEEEICFTGYHQFLSPSISPVIGAINEAVDSCDYIVVYAHWGAEYESEPSVGQEEIGRAFIDAGADLVIGAHPHVVQPIEVYRGKAIFYSLGNFIFDQDFSLATRQGLAVRLELAEDRQRFHLIGVEMERNRLYFPEKEAYRPSMDALISRLPEEHKTLADVDGILVLPR